MWLNREIIDISDIMIPKQSVENKLNSQTGIERKKNRITVALYT